MSTLYYGIASFGSFVIGVGTILYAAYWIVDAIYRRDEEKEREQRIREWYSKRGG